jgi:hypothetical protein
MYHPKIVVVVVVDFVVWLEHHDKMLLRMWESCLRSEVHPLSVHHRMPVEEL